MERARAAEARCCLERHSREVSVVNARAGAIFGDGVAPLVLRHPEVHPADVRPVTHTRSLPCARPRAPRRPLGASSGLGAVVLTLLLTAGLVGAAAADEAAGFLRSEESPAAWTLRPGPEGRLALAADPQTVRSGPDAFLSSGWEESAPREASPFSLLPHDFGEEVRPAQGWALLAEDEKVLSDKGVDEPKKAGPDWPGIGRDTAFFFAYQAISVGILYVLPGDFNRWANKDLSFEHWWDNVRNPVWDTDPWATNYISHPYWGAAYYIRARERGFDKWASFGYSAFLSTLYEFGAEAFFEPPSGQDLMATPILGSLLGAFVFEPIRDWVKAKPQRPVVRPGRPDRDGSIRGLEQRVRGHARHQVGDPLSPHASDHRRARAARWFQGPKGRGLPCQWGQREPQDRLGVIVGRPQSWPHDPACSSALTRRGNLC